MGANAAYWQVRIEDVGRTIVAYKSMYDPNPDPALKTAMFRELIPPRYECELIGIQHQGARLYWQAGDYTVQAAAVRDLWMRGTGFTPGSVIRGVVSIETDTIPGNQTAASSCGHPLTVFFHRELGGDKDGNPTRPAMSRPPARSCSRQDPTSSPGRLTTSLKSAAGRAASSTHASSASCATRSTQ
jgi:hypothetical protein